MSMERTPAQRRLRLLLGGVGGAAGGVWGAVSLVLVQDGSAAAVLAGRAEPEALALVVALLAAVPVGSLLGAVPLDLLSHAVGRRPAVLVSAVLVILGSLLGGVTHSWGRPVGALIAGLGLGGYAVVAPKLAHELAARGHRRLVPRLSGLLPAGAGTALVLGELTRRWKPEEGPVGAWIVPLILAVAVLLLAIGLPETPHWYAAHGRVEAALASLRRMSGALEAAVGIDWVLMDAGTLGEQHPLTAADLRIDRVRRTVLVGLVLELAQALPMGLAAICLAPALLAQGATEPPLAAVVVLAAAWGVLGVLSLRRQPGRMLLAWVVAGTGVAACGVVLLFVLDGLDGPGARLLVLVVTTMLVAAQYVGIAPACTGGTDPLVPPWLLRSQRRAEAVLRPLVQLVTVLLPTVLLGSGVSVKATLGAVLALQVVGLLGLLGALGRINAALR
ncbi:MFS transporter [Actinomyces howellii]|uniref:MFS transporter, sugar porter (SP) family n=1 Tax=Actinomyces howellii TaxID=52771 RepID=A0A3S4T9D6_9ACTO|nr:MFS transporter [Actinomyces howellii]VEG27417.1 MFS transporter, sugar porter (SP) family [Actinomyces howellii]